MVFNSETPMWNLYTRKDMSRDLGYYSSMYKGRFTFDIMLMPVYLHDEQCPFCHKFASITKLDSVVPVGRYCKSCGHGWHRCQRCAMTSIKLNAGIPVQWDTLKCWNERCH